jgi:hypothetical protein
MLSINLYAWDNTTNHKDFSEIAARMALDINLLNTNYSYNGVEKTLSKWIQDGADFEDAGDYFQALAGKGRFANHFHNPLALLTEAGLNDTQSGESALRWAQDGQNQAKFVEGDWSWAKVRDHWYRSLTATGKADIDEFTVKTFRGLGHQMHLIQDMAQPDHVRNDAHPTDGLGLRVHIGFEKWAEKEYTLIRQIGASGTRPNVDLTPQLYNLVPIGRLIDTRRYFSDMTPSNSSTQGLAEYTNANFFSDDTIFAARFTADDKHYFPYPRKEGTDLQDYIEGRKQPERIISEDGKAVDVIWISKTGEGETIPHLLRTAVVTDLIYQIFGEGKLFYGSMFRDEICHRDYADKLAPRAVGYSAALLDYFFRGTIELTFPAPANESFRYIRLKAKNTTVNGEELTNPEEIKLVVRHKQARMNPAEGKVGPEPIPQGEDGYHYLVVPLKNSIATIPRDTTVDLEFDLSDTPIPMWSYDVSLQVVYKGQLGNETGAVAVGRIVLPAINGDIQLTVPDKGLYGITTPNGSFSEIRVKASNIATGTDDMSAGNIELFIQHKRASQDPFQNQPTDKSPAEPEYYYIRVPEKNGVPTIPRGSATELVFNLSAKPFPIWATDVQLYVVYTGQIGEKANQVAIGYNNIAEPTPINLVNNMDYICINGSYLQAGSQAAINAVGTNDVRPLWDIYPHRLKDVYLAFTSTPASATNYSARIPVIQPGEYSRVFLLTDYSFNISSSVTVEKIADATHDIWLDAFENSVETFHGVTNEVAYVNGEYVDYYPEMFTERGMLIWSGITYDNTEWPAGATCDQSGASRLIGPVAVEFPQ